MVSPQRQTNPKLTPIPNKKNQAFISSLYANSRRTTVPLVFPELGIDGELEVAAPTYKIREVARKYAIAAVCRLVTPPEELAAIEDIFSDEKLEKRCWNKLKLIQDVAAIGNKTEKTPEDEKFLADREDELVALNLALIANRDANEYLFRIIPALYPEIENPEELHLQVLSFLAMGVIGVLFAIES